jgi:iron complex outermembrane receptor protein
MVLSIVMISSAAPPVSLSASAGYTKSELQENVLSSINGLGQRIVIPLAGKELVESPDWTFALRGDFEFTENFHVGLQGKYVGDRYSTDLNDEVAPNYTIFDIDASYAFKVPGFDSMKLQFTMSNITGEDYFGTISSGVGGQAGVPYCVNEATGAATACGNPGVGFFSIGAPRTAVFSIKLDF